MIRLEFDIPDYMGGPLPYGLEALKMRISLALANAHVRAVEGEATASAPSRTGTLKNAIRAYFSGLNSGVLEASAPHADYLHWGTGIYGPRRMPVLIEPKGKRALWWPGAIHPVRAVRHKGIRPRDFLRHAVLMYFPALRAFAVALRMEVIAIFGRNYMKLREARDHYLTQQETQNDLPYGTLDKYFHCKANCEATQLGYLVESVSISVVKEEFDLTIHNWFFGGEHTLKDSMEDMGANLKGLRSGTMAPSTPCSASCSGYRPDRLPENLW
jgi:hypothetical protein